MCSSLIILLQLVCKTMEVLIIAQSSVVEHDAMSLVAKLLTICAEVYMATYCLLAARLVFSCHLPF